MNQRFTLSHVRYFIDSVGLDEDDLNALIEHLQDKQRAQSASIWSKVRDIFCCREDSTMTRDSLDLTRTRFNIDPNTHPAKAPSSPARLAKYQDKGTLSLDTQPPSPSRRKALSISVPRTPPSPGRAKAQHARFEQLAMSPRMQTLASIFMDDAPKGGELHTIFEDIAHLGVRDCYIVTSHACSFVLKLMDAG